LAEAALRHEVEQSLLPEAYSHRVETSLEGSCDKIRPAPGKVAALDEKVFEIVRFGIGQPGIRPRALEGALIRRSAS
jgi:hypothetical protein